MSVNFEYYKVFYYVAQHKSITAAARALFLSQPTVSHYIGASEMTLHNFLLPYLEQFKNHYPALKLKISSSTTPGTLRALREGSVDFAIVISPLEDTGGFSVTPLTSFQDIVIAGKRFRELEGKRLSLKELTRYPVICLSQGTATRKFLEQQFLDEGVSLEPDVEPATTDLVTPLTAHNLGVGFVPENFAAEALRAESVFRISLKKELPPRHICVVSDSSHPVSLAGRQFMSLLPSCSD